MQAAEVEGKEGEEKDGEQKEGEVTEDGKGVRGDAEGKVP